MIPHHLLLRRRRHDGAVVVVVVVVDVWGCNIVVFMITVEAVITRTQATGTLL